MEVRYHASAGVGHLEFTAHNGAMDLTHCQLLMEKYQQAVADENTKVIVLWGGPDFFSNGLDLNSIHLRYNPTILAYKNLKALNKLVKTVLNTTGKLVLAALRGSAAAGGVMLALAADLRYGRDGVVLNPSYVNMGLSGSEYWSILLPSMLGYGRTQKLIYEANPISCEQAVSWGLLHEKMERDPRAFAESVTQKAEYLAQNNVEARIAAKAVLNRRLLQETEEQVKFELWHMKERCNHPEFEKARTDFVE